MKVWNVIIKLIVNGFSIVAVLIIHITRQIIIAAIYRGNFKTIPRGTNETSLGTVATKIELVASRAVGTNSQIEGFGDLGSGLCTSVGLDTYV